MGYDPSGLVNIWSMETGEVLQIIEPGDGEITSLCWSRDDRFLAVATSDVTSRVHIFECDDKRHGSGREPKAPVAGRSAARIISIDQHLVTAMTFAPLTNQLAASTEQGIHLVPPGAQSPVAVIQHAQPAQFLDYDPAGRRLAAVYSGEQTVRVFDINHGEILYEADAPRQVGCVRFSPNGRRLATVGYDSLVYLCDAETGHRLITLAGTDDQVGTTAIIPRVIFSRNGRRIAVNDWHGRITIWEAEPHSAAVFHSRALTGIE